MFFPTYVWEYLDQSPCSIQTRWPILSFPFFLGKRSDSPILIHVLSQAELCEWLQNISNCFFSPDFQTIMFHWLPRKQIKKWYVKKNKFESIFISLPAWPSSLSIIFSCHHKVIDLLGNWTNPNLSPKFTYALVISFCFYQTFLYPFPHFSSPLVQI